MDLPDISDKSVRLNVHLGGRWLDLGTAVVKVDANGETIALLDYIPSKPLDEQELPDALHDHLESTRASSEGENHSHA